MKCVHHAPQGAFASEIASARTSAAARGQIGSDSFAINGLRASLRTWVVLAAEGLWAKVWSKA